MSRFRKQFSSRLEPDNFCGDAVDAMYTDFIAESGRIEGIKRLLQRHPSTSLAHPIPDSSLVK